ncbi:MAG: hypothetical protein COB49_04705 [Alphaproteobacteria bacterium]|nr:MAG: hypothetical protein COB49_04705 [Alphaproteobacteria bacterium]
MKLSCYTDYMEEDNRIGDSGSSSWLVTAKVMPPKHHITLAERKPALDILLRNQERSLTIMEATGGFGKTTLLSLWRIKLLDMGHTVAWVTLDAEDTANTLITYFTYAFQTAGLNMDEPDLLLDSGSERLDPLHQLNILINLLQNVDKKIVLMLDDVDRMIDQEALQILNMMIRHAPDNLHIAIAYRHNPGIALSNLLLDGTAIRLTAFDLRFSYDEIGELFEGRLSKRDMETIHERSEGWPVALRLMKREIDNNWDYIDKIQHFSGGRGLVSEYFNEQLFLRLTEEEKTFLLDISILEWLEAPLIDAVRETSNASYILNEILHLEGIIVPLEGKGDTYRLHALFRDFLIDLYKAKKPERFINLHRKAAYALAKRNRLLTALRHATLAGDKILIGEILEQAGGIKLWVREGMTRIIPANQMIDDEIISYFPRLGLLRCIVLIKTGHIKAAQALYNHIKKETSGFQRDRIGGNDSSLYMDHTVIRSMLAAYAGLPLSSELISLVSNEINNTEDVESSMIGFYNNMLCLAKYQRADFSEAWYHGQESASYYEKIGSEYGNIFIDFHFGAIAMAQGKASEASGYISRASRNAHRFFPTDKEPRLIGEILTAELKLEKNDTKGLSRKFEDITQRLYESEAWFDIYAVAYSVAVEIIKEQGIKDIGEFLKNAIECAEEKGLSKLISFLVALQVHILIIDGQKEKAQLLYGKSDIPKTIDEIFNLENNSWREVEIYSFCFILIKMTTSSFDEARTVLSRFLAFSEKNNLIRSLIRCLVLAARLEDSANDKALAYYHLEKALKQSLQNDYIRPFIRGGEQIKNLLMGFKNIESKDKELILQADKIISHFQLAQNSDMSKILFSQKEIEILQGLNQGLQDKMIALNLGVTPHAVRYHLKKIYVKTKAKNRIQAVNRAKELCVIKNSI